MAGIVAAFSERASVVASEIWSDEQFQISLFLPAAAAYVWSKNPPVLAGLKPGRAWITVALFVVAAMLCFDALLLRAGKSWIVGAVIGVLAVGHAVGGFQLLLRSWPAAILLVLMIQPPDGIYLQLITRLQLMTSYYASDILERFLSVPHVLTGNIVHLHDRELFVEEACSGINSLYTTLLILAFVVVYLRRPWWNAAALIGLGLVCVLAVNVLRVVMLTDLCYLDPKLGAYFLHGTPHTLFGVFCFALVLILLVSCDVLIVAAGRWWGWNDTPDSPPVDRSAESTDWRMLVPSFLGRPVLWTLVAVLFWSVAAGQWVLAAAHVEEDRLDIRDPFAGSLEGLLPPRMGNLPLADYQEEQRGDHFLEANFSSSWRYQLGDQTLIVHVHRPYREWHHLQSCFRAAGWSLSNQEHGTVPLRSGGGNKLHYVTFRVDQADAPSKVIGYTMVDSASGRFLSPSYEQFDYVIRLRAKKIEEFMLGPERQTVAGIVVELEGPARTSPEARKMMEEVLRQTTLKLLGFAQETP